MVTLKIVVTTFLFGVVASSFTPQQQSYVKAKNIMTNINDLNSIERFLLGDFLSEHNLKPESAPSKPLAEGFFTENLLDLPHLLLQLVKIGKQVQFPSYQYEQSFYTCVIGCFGVYQLYDMKNAVVHNIVPASITGGVVNGNEFWLSYDSGHFEIRCPECVVERQDLADNPPLDTITSIKKNFTLSIKNITMLTTFKLNMTPTGLQMENLDFTLSVGDISRRYENETITYPDGGIDQRGEQVEDFVPFWNEWQEDGFEEGAEEACQDLFNYFLAGGQGGEGDQYTQLAMAQLIHGLGLGAFVQSPDNDDSYKCLVDVLPSNKTEFDEITLINKVLFEYATQVLQTGRLIGEVWERLGFSPEREMPIFVRFIAWCYKEVCADDGTSCEIVSDEIAIGNPGQEGGEDGTYYSTWFYGWQGNTANVNFSKNHLSYNFTVPSFQFRGDDAVHQIRKAGTRYRHRYLGLTLYVADSSIGIDADFDFSDGRFNVENLSVELSLEKVLIEWTLIMLCDEANNCELIQREEKNIAEKIMQLWNNKDADGLTLREKYSIMLQDKINNVLVSIYSERK